MILPHSKPPLLTYHPSWWTCALQWVIQWALYTDIQLICQAHGVFPRVNIMVSLSPPSDLQQSNTFCLWHFSCSCFIILNTISAVVFPPWSQPRMTTRFLILNMFYYLCSSTTSKWTCVLVLPIFLSLSRDWMLCIIRDPGLCLASDETRMWANLWPFKPLWSPCLYTLHSPTVPTRLPLDSLKSY